MAALKLTSMGFRRNDDKALGHSIVWIFTKIFPRKPDDAMPGPIGPLTLMLACSLLCFSAAAERFIPNLE
jgi:hypothetical protein